MIGKSVVGRGGTDLCAPFRAIEESKDGRFQLIDALIIITDGLGPVPSKPPSFPVLWVLAPHGHNKCTFGAEVSLPPDE
jgi:predicted metal-dependent peptidase